MNFFERFLLFMLMGIILLIYCTFKKDEVQKPEEFWGLGVTIIGGIMFVIFGGLFF